MNRRSGWSARCVTLGLVLASASVAAVDIDGRAQVIDGDSLRVGGVEIRLKGIDAPEFDQVCKVDGKDWRCGRAAAETLQFLTSNKTVRCRFDERDHYDRALATCYRDELNINAMMVEVGMAMAYRRYSGAYIEQEDIARRATRGIWDSEFVPPWDWPRGHRRDDTTDCPVKGNVNRAGRRILHTRASPQYDKVRIKPHEGDRCFATVAEAKRAGFREPGGQ